MKISQKFWFQLHGWCSLPVWLIFTAVCLTGTIAVLSHELTWLFNENARAYNPQNLPAKPLAELVAAVQQAEPTAAVTSVMVLEPYLVTAVLFTTETMPAAIAYVNPYTGVVQEINPGINFISFMRSLHGWLLFPWQHSYSVGYYLVSAMSLLMLGALITGLIIYKRFWQSFTAPKLRLHQGKKTVLADLHRLAGVWSLWFLLLMSLTGLWYLIQAVLWHNDVEFYYEAEQLSSLYVPAPAADGKVPDMIPLAQAVARAQQFLPELQPAFVMMPEHPRDYYRISGYGDSVWFDQYSYNVWINPWTGEVADSRVPAQMGGLETVMSVADPLHYGTIGGLWTKVIWFVFGLLVSGMAITGFMIWGSRTIRGAAGREAQARVEQAMTAALPIQTLSGATDNTAGAKQ
ncbi:PepSY-associated TM helix domain-containing protein [Rheinheimera texasensis]|uniref:PepSY-associated TM helix domain-containing protein n=1 Tax=Rheinheimera texasensis TaxID=306205 RepID=UPI0009FD68A1|nr:PepSY-associated TM helix domain-containing protein [Rheinheimera texasensis]